ncbi:ferric reductase [Paenibacillus athensensis]|uniref:Ferric oxidoreductase domain-containing protein n=1 Tax=Paenibacillus athensensis TaxID=1967502 RepID=A0A4Y8PW28_9BACL|nr:ferric reductase [Paenibacillus athensensis]MCD1258871.1 ferric reductase [Paenibacillus athensensis]
MESFFHLPVWALIRGLGLAAYVSLFAGMACGIMFSFPFWIPKEKARLLRWHNAANYTGTALALLHGLLLSIDAYVTFSWREIFVPFTAASHPVLNGIGTLAMLGLVLVLLTTDLRNKLKRALWLAFHLLSYPIFLLALAHGLFLGTDSGNTLVKSMYIVTFAALLLLTAMRMIWRVRKIRPRIGHVNEL